MAGRSSTLFQLHHAEARSASRRLSLQFSLGVALSALIYCLISAAMMLVFFTFLQPEQPTGDLFLQLQQAYGKHHQTIWTVGLLAGVGCAIVILLAYWEAIRRFRNNSAEQIALRMGAARLPDSQQAKYRQIRNVIEEMAVASGIALPPILHIPKDDSINAFVTGGKDRSVAVVISNGVMNYLDRDEQQAIIAHEFGHIVNEDVFLYAQLSAILEGYFTISQWRNDAGHLVSAAQERFWTGVRSPTVVKVIIGYVSFFMLMIGRHLQAAFSREREWMADARSVQFTRHPEGLVMALKKALALQVLQKGFFAAPESGAFAVYQLCPAPSSETRHAPFSGIAH